MTAEQDNFQTASTFVDSSTDSPIPSPTVARALMNSPEFDSTNTVSIGHSTVSLEGSGLAVTDAQMPASIKRKFRPMRFAIGLTLTTISVSLILWVAIRMLDVHYFGGRFALALVAIVVMSSVMMLGAGFGLMATAAADFDDSEFERLIRSGNISSAEVMMTEAPPRISDNSPNRRSAA